MLASKTARNVETRRSQLMAAAESYFDGLRKRDVSRVPWHEAVILRSPLAPGSPDQPLRGRGVVQEWFAALYPVLGDVNVIEHHWNAGLTAVASRADVHIRQPRCVLRVIDRFVVDADGLITEQENHYDPRPVLVPSEPATGGRLTTLERDMAVELLEQSRDLFLSCVGGLTENQWRRDSGDGRWSIAQCAEHVAVSEEALLSLVRDKILQQPADPEKVGTVQGKDGVVIQAMRDRSTRLKTFDFLEPIGRWRSRDELLQVFSERRALTIEFVRGTNAPLHHHFAPLGGLGDLDAYQWILLLATHTERHVRQIEELLNTAY